MKGSVFGGEDWLDDYTQVKKRICRDVPAATTERWPQHASRLKMCLSLSCCPGNFFHAVDFWVELYMITSSVREQENVCTPCDLFTYLPLSGSANCKSSSDAPQLINITVPPLRLWPSN